MVHPHTRCRQQPILRATRSHHSIPSSPPPCHSRVSPACSSLGHGHDSPLRADSSPPDSHVRPASPASCPRLSQSPPGHELGADAEDPGVAGGCRKQSGSRRGAVEERGGPGQSSTGTASSSLGPVPGLLGAHWSPVQEVARLCPPSGPSCHQVVTRCMASSRCPWVQVSPGASVPGRLEGAAGQL